MVTENPEIIDDTNTSPTTVNESGEFEKGVSIRIGKKMFTKIEKISPFLLDCIRDDIDNHPYDTRQRHPIQSYMRI